MARNLRLAEVAVACDVDQSTVWRWETGLIPLERLPVLADLLDVDMAYLAGFLDDERAA